MTEALADRVIERHRKRLHGRARRITIDLDPTDDPTVGLATMFCAWQRPAALAAWLGIAECCCYKDFEGVVRITPRGLEAAVAIPS